MQDLIVESRQWLGGIEVVSHVNHTQLARVRMALGVGHESWRNPLGAAGRGRDHLRLVRDEPSAVRVRAGTGRISRTG